VVARYEVYAVLPLLEPSFFHNFDFHLHLFVLPPVFLNFGSLLLFFQFLQLLRLNVVLIANLEYFSLVKLLLPSLFLHDEVC
jgi:hypothetical protein